MVGSSICYVTLYRIRGGSKISSLLLQHMWMAPLRKSHCMLYDAKVRWSPVSCNIACGRVRWQCLQLLDVWGPDIFHIADVTNNSPLTTIVYTILKVKFSSANFRCCVFRDFIFIFIHQSMVDSIKNKINKNTSHIWRTRTQINVQSLQCIRQTDCGVFNDLYSLQYGSEKIIQYKS